MLGFDRFELSRLAGVLSGGSPVPPELAHRVEQRFGVRFTTVYGQTELSPVVTQTNPDDSPGDKATTAGRPLPQVEVAIRDPATGETVPTGQPGEICARGYQAMLGYAFCRTSLAPHKTPARWFGATELPLTGSGKIQKFRLRGQIDGGELTELPPR